MWWLALCMIMMCVIERTKLENVANAVWFNAFSLSKWMVTHYLLFLYLALSSLVQRSKPYPHTEPLG